MNYIASIITDQGPCMSINEDSSILRHESWNGHQVIFAAVCDGVGGLRLGEAASGSIIHQLDEDFISEIIASSPSFMALKVLGIELFNFSPITIISFSSLI